LLKEACSLSFQLERQHIYNLHIPIQESTVARKL